MNDTLDSSLPTTPSPATEPLDSAPLAFAAKPTTATESVVPTVGSSYLPPTPPPTASVPTNTTEEPKKKAGSKIMMLVLGFVSLLGVLGGIGYFAYNLYGTANPILIAGVKDNDKDSCNGCYNGGWLRWDNATQTCKHTGICDSGVPGKDTEPPENPGTPVAEKPRPADGNCGTGYTYCGGDINKCVSHGALAAAGGGCNKYGEVVYGIATNYGANAYAGSCDKVSFASQQETQCMCGTKTYCFDRTATNMGCTVPTKDAQGNLVTRSDGSVLEMGLCGIVATYYPNSTNPKNINNSLTTNKDWLFNADGTMKYGINCTNTSCQTTSGQCGVYRYTCSGTKTGNSCTENRENLGLSGGFASKCGTVEQLDVACQVNGQLTYALSRTRINPPCEPKESEPPTTTTTPTMACTGLTRSPNTASPAIGDTLTFTCAGSVTPSTAGTLSYKFRYKIGSGALTTLPNKTTTTAELTLAACGTYTVECQACTTLNGVLTCDPKWTGATQ